MVDRNMDLWAVGDEPLESVGNLQMWKSILLQRILRLIPIKLLDSHSTRLRLWELASARFQRCSALLRQRLTHPLCCRPRTSSAILSTSVLQRFNDGSGMLGSFRDAATGFGQARFHQVDPGTIQSVATMPYDPTMLFMAAALAQINQKLDAIQDTVNEMFEYMRQKDKAELRGNIKTLEDVLEAYRYNWNNDIWRKNAHMKVVDIKQESEKAIIHLRAQIRTKMGEKSPVELRFAVGGRLDKVIDRLKEYQLATYTYSFATFLEPMLSENFDEANLNAIAAKISDHGNEYRKLYTECYNAIEESSKASADAVALRGASAAFAGLGAFVKQTPLGERTSVDEALEKVGRGVGSFNEGQTRSLMEKLQHAKTPNVLPFKQSLEAVNNLHNHPHQLAADGENVYLLPFSRMCVVTDS